MMDVSIYLISFLWWIYPFYDGEIVSNRIMLDRQSFMTDEEDFGNDFWVKLTFLWENRLILAICKLPVTLNELKYNLKG